MTGSCVRVLAILTLPFIAILASLSLTSPTVHAQAPTPVQQAITQFVRVQHHQHAPQSHRRGAAYALPAPQASPVYAVRQPRVAPPIVVADGPVAAIAAAAAHWGVSFTWLMRIARCESGLNPQAYNASSGASGLFQFMPSTYQAYAGRIGETRSLWDAAASASVAGYMFSQGLSGQWSCR